jgi:hypothetical protein
MTIEQFATQIDKLITLASEGGLPNEAMAGVLEEALDRLDEGVKGDSLAS